MNISNDKILFDYNEFGKPSLKPIKIDRFKFNVSHSKEFSIIALNYNDNIGVDIEFINPEIDIKDIASKYFSKYEQNQLAETSENIQLNRFFKICTCK